MIDIIINDLNKSNQKECFDNLFDTFSHQVHLFDHMSVVEKRLSVAFSDFWNAQHNGLIKHIYPGQKALAKKADCSVKAVYRYLIKYPFLVRVVARKRSPNRFRDTNIYIPDNNFFEAIAFLKYKKFIKNWKKEGRSLVMDLIDNEEDKIKELGWYKGVMNNEMSERNAVKCPITPTNPQDRRKEVPSCSQVPFYNNIFEEEGFGGLGISKETRQFMRFASPYVLCETRLDIRFAKKHKVYIRHPDAWLKDRIQDHSARQHQILYKIKIANMMKANKTKPKGPI